MHPSSEPRLSISSTGSTSLNPKSPLNAAQVKNDLGRLFQRSQRLPRLHSIAISAYTPASPAHLNANCFLFGSPRLFHCASLLHVPATLGTPPDMAPPASGCLYTATTFSEPPLRQPKKRHCRNDGTRSLHTVPARMSAPECVRSAPSGESHPPAAAPSPSAGHSSLPLPPCAPGSGR